MPLVHVTGLAKEYDGHRAVDGVSYVIGRGETLGLIGESGSGKTTTGRCLLRLTEATTGTVLFDGEDISRLRGRALRRWRRHAQIVFQDPFGSLNPRMTIGRTLSEPLVVHRICSRAELASRVADLLRQVGLRPADACRYPHQLSGGQRQRVAIARALAVQPQLVVLDEVLSALDIAIQLQIIDLLRQLQVATGVSYLFISHNLDAVRLLAHRAVVLYAGRIVESGATADLLARPRHPYTKALVAAGDPVSPFDRTTNAPQSAAVFANPPRASGCAYHPLCPLANSTCIAVPPPLLTLDCGRQVACHVTEQADA